MTFVISGRITADGGQARAELDRTATSAENVGKSAAQASAGTQQLDRATDQLAASQRSAATAADVLTGGQARANQIIQNGTRNIGLQRAAYQQLGFQSQDVFQQLTLGINPMIVLAQQGGQVAQAFDMMGRSQGGAQTRAAAFAAFMAGPWGAAVLGGITVVGLLTQKYFENTEAAKEAELGASALGDAQNQLGKIFDLTSGKLKEQNELLLLNARITAINLRAQASADRASASKVFSSAQNLSSSELFFRTVALRGKGLSNNRLPDAAKLAIEADTAFKDLSDPRALQSRLDDIIKRSEGVDFKQVGSTQAEFLSSLAKAFAADGNEAIADDIDKSLNSGVLASSLRKPGKNEKTAKPAEPKVDREAEKALSFFERADDQVERLINRFSDVPGLFKQIEAAELTLTNLEEQAAKTTRLTAQQQEELATKIAAARDELEDAAARPYRQLTAAGEEQLNQLSLILQGRTLEAEALQRITQFEERNGQLNEEQREAILAQVTAEEELNRQIDQRLQKLSIYGASVDEVRGSLEQLLSGGNAGDFLDNLQSSFQNLQGRLLTDKLFGPVEQKLEDFLSGRQGLETQIETLGDAHEKVAHSSERLADATNDVADAIWAAANRINSPTFFTDTPSFGNGAFDPEAGIVVDAPNNPPTPSLDPTAQQFFEELIDDMVGNLSGEIDEIFGVGFFSDMRGVFSGALSGFAQAGTVGAALGGIAGLADTLEGISTEDRRIARENNEELGSGINQALQQAFGGAVTGFRTSALLDAVGIGNSRTGSAIGGAVGSFVPIPGGDIIGSLLGGQIGQLFRSSRSGSATITSANGDISTSGNNDDRIRVSSGLAGSVQDNLRQIADALGGDLGAFSVSIGQRNDEFRVDTTGQGRTRGPTGSERENERRGLFNFGDDAAAAQAFALGDAIADGAITGLSTAVQRALQSSDDINRAIEEALLVQDVERLLGGPTVIFDEELRQFERQANERLRIAQQYGFDVLEIERINAEERVNLVDGILEDRVGALQELLEDLAFGDLSEGTAVERRSRLLDEIAEAEAAATRGDEGAADRLANLNRRLVTQTRDDFGTAGGEFTSDREAAISSAERVIEIETQRLQDAQDARLGTNERLDTNNRLANETNDILAEIRAEVARSGGFGTRTISQAGSAARNNGSGFSRDVDLL